MRSHLDKSETIFALCSGPLPSAVAIVRVSGPRALSIGREIFRSSSFSGEFERGMYFGSFVGEGETPIDEGLLLVFPDNRSFTGEPSLEFQCHGSPAVVCSLEKRLIELAARPAQPGEFSYRAYLNQKLSPVEIENLRDLFRAQDSIDIANIYRRRDGATTALVERLRGALTGLLAVLDTAIDFSEEYAEVTQQAQEPLDLAIRECSLAIQRYARLSGTSNAPRVALVGRPNAGKSSLFNAILCRYRAIVHDEPGTTRDVLEEDFVLNGRRWRLVDTAGRHDEATGTEREGIELGDSYLKGASFWILVVDGTIGISEVERALLQRYGSKPFVIAWNKSDLPNWNYPADLSTLPVAPVRLSALHADGMDTFWAAMEAMAGASAPNARGPLPTHREYAALLEVNSRLLSLREHLDGDELPEYLSEEARVAVNLLESFVGEVDTEQVLDRIFSAFCIGK
ncbi:MAG: tRNA modification GTPase [Bdellovibrionales bacterium]|nr:tRNA modification GTPase [Bdellovibrionales bacterium]